MKARLIARVRQSERHKTREDAEDPLNVQIGYLKSLLADHPGERHVLTVGQHAAGRARPGRYAFEERHGIAPNAENILRVCLVKALGVKKAWSRARRDWHARTGRLRDNMKAILTRIRRMEQRLVTVDDRRS